MRPDSRRVSDVHSPVDRGEEGMAKRNKSLSPLGETEMEVLDIVWEMRVATVTDVRERILQTREVAYTTIMTVMRNLADKGFLKFEKDGATYVYSAARSRQSVTHDLVDDLVQKVFRGSHSAMVRTLVSGGPISDDELREIRKLIDSNSDDEGLAEDKSDENN